jgi:hypothetical protein
MFLAGAVLGLGFVVSEGGFDVVGYEARVLASAVEGARKRLEVSGWVLTPGPPGHWRCWKRFENARVHEVQSASLDGLEEAARGYDELQGARGERERAGAREVERVERERVAEAELDAEVRAAEQRAREKLAEREREVI